VSDLHDEEHQAEVGRYVLWCEGRLEELRRVSGQREMGHKTNHPLFDGECLVDERRLLRFLYRYDQTMAR
jgi:hypothetical protein